MNLSKTYFNNNVFGQIRLCANRPGRWLKILLSIFACLWLLGCDTDNGERGRLVSTASGQNLELDPPLSVTHRAVNQSQLFPRVTLNGDVLNMSVLNSGVIWQGTTQLPEGEPATLRVDWIEFFRGRELLLAVAERTYPVINRNTAVTLFETDYVIDDLVTYPRLDDDNDKVPNLTERVENSDPLLSTDPGNFRADAFIQPIQPEQAPVIDGSYDLIWGQAQFRDRDAELLNIDNRIIGFDPNRPDGNTEFRWGGLHDGQYLYLYVLGESAETRTPQGDSISPWHDDAIDLFWDGDRSQGSTYDGFDDFHLIIPLMKLNSGTRNRSTLEDGTIDPDGRAETGFFSAPIEALDGVEFATCICPAGDTYEIRLDLQKLMIPVGRSFGFDVQINNDVDGGDREYKFGWRAPSAAEGEFSNDLTWSDPSRMGLLELAPFD